MQKIIEFDANAGMKLCFLFALRCAIEPASEWTNEIRLVHYLRKTREVLGHYCGSGTAASCKRNSTDLRWKIVEIDCNRYELSGFSSSQNWVSRIHSDFRLKSFIECARAVMPLYASSKRCWWHQSLFRRRFFPMQAGSITGAQLPTLTKNSQHR